MASSAGIYCNFRGGPFKLNLFFVPFCFVAITVVHPVLIFQNGPIVCQMEVPPHLSFCTGTAPWLDNFLEFSWKTSSHGTFEAFLTIEFVGSKVHSTQKIQTFSISYQVDPQASDKHWHFLLQLSDLWWERDVSVNSVSFLNAFVAW